MKKTIFVYGTFNVLHSGHLRLLKYAKKLGDDLVVGVYSDTYPGSANIINQKLRIEALKSIGWISKVILIKDVIKSIKKINPQIIVKGKEFANKKNSEITIIKSIGAKLLFSSGDSMSAIDEFYSKEIKSIEGVSLNLEKDFILRHKIKVDGLISSIKNFNKLKICVIGDTIVDEYINCNPLGMSQEDPSIVFSPISSTKYLGGAAIVAAHGASLGSSVDFISVCGKDDAKDFVIKKLNSLKVNSKIFEDDNKPTIIKQRFRSNGKTVFKLSHLRNEDILSKIEKKIINFFKSRVSTYDLLIFSDFNYGCLTQNLISTLTDIAKKNHLIITADSQSSSQIGDILKYKNIDLLTPTEREARVSLKNEKDGLVVLATNITSLTNTKNLIVKLGDNGLLIYKEPKNNEVFTDEIGALSNYIEDTAGAGDSMLIAMSLMLAGKNDIWRASLIGSIAAAIQVSRIGNIPIKQNEILNILKTKLIN
tara:strand:+ start:11244 stop:12683 length:1440 start_codon:yes stop_codon:yes gene_type:complete